MASRLEDELEKELEKNLSNAGKPETPIAPPAASPFNYKTIGKVDGYGELERILGMAYDQAAKGKGHSRHAHSPIGFRPWDEQPILANARQVGPAGPGQQCMKKTQESVMMAARKDFVGAKAEMLGVIVYAAALIKLYEEMEKV